MMGIIGIILLIGIVKKNGIMLVDFALAAEHHRGLSSEDSIHGACRLRFRPDFDDHAVRAPGRGAADAGKRNRVGDATAARLAMVGGLFVSQLLTLFTTPVVYIYMDRISDWLGGRIALAILLRYSRDVSNGGQNRA